VSEQEFFDRIAAELARVVPGPQSAARLSGLFGADLSEPFRVD
jgi:hypothetical protein